MAGFMKDRIDSLAQYWGKRTTPQRILIGGLTVAVIASFIMMIVWLNKPDYKVLYSNLFPEDAARVVETLNGLKAPYELMDDGKTILVPADQVYDLRLKIAGEGALHGQGRGV